MSTPRGTMYHAYVWRSGLIEIGDAVPIGAMSVLADPDKSWLTDLVSVRARHAHDGTLLVPGVAEADRDEDAVNALMAWKWSLLGGRRQ